jgi:hypothetical protein
MRRHRPEVEADPVQERAEHLVRRDRELATARRDQHHHAEGDREPDEQRPRGHPAPGLNDRHTAPSPTR